VRGSGGQRRPAEAVQVRSQSAVAALTLAGSQRNQRSEETFKRFQCRHRRQTRWWCRSHRDGHKLSSPVELI